MRPEDFTKSCAKQLETVNARGLVLRPGIDRETWVSLLSELAQRAAATADSSDTLTAWLGDVLAYAEGKFRGQTVQLAELTGLSASTLRNAKLVCSRIPLNHRRTDLSWSHHCEAAKACRELPLILSWLQLAATEQLSKAELRKRIRQEQQEASGPQTKADCAPFALLRELRGIERRLRDLRSVWENWPAETCQRALQENVTLGDFVAVMQRRMPLRLTGST